MDEGDLTQLATFYPYGALRLDDHPATFDQSRKFLGQHQDRATELSYLNARYYDGGRGGFLSQDPMFLGDPNGQRLANPQELNAYSYAAGNPIVWSDPSGLCVGVFECGYNTLSLGAYDRITGQLAPQAEYLGVGNTKIDQAWDFALNNPVRAGITVGIVSGIGALAAENVYVMAPSIATAAKALHPELVSTKALATGVSIAGVLGAPGTLTTVLSAANEAPRGSSLMSTTWSATKTIGSALIEDKIKTPVNKAVNNVVNAYKARLDAIEKQIKQIQIQVNELLANQKTDKNR